MIVTAWNNGQHHKSGAGYGLKISIEDRDAYFKKEWEHIIVEMPDYPNFKLVKVNVNKPSFWNESCRELISKDIGIWMINNGYAPWEKEKPPKFRMEHLSENRFSIKHLSDIAYQLIDEMTLSRENVIIIEAIIQLEILIDAIIIIHFFKYPSTENTLHPSYKHFEKHILKQYRYGKKVELLKKCGLIDATLNEKLINLGKFRNDISHTTSFNYDDKDVFMNLDFIDLNIKFIHEIFGINFIDTNDIYKTNEISYKEINDFIDDFVNCYSELIALLLSLKEK
jgi:hypothetical protein